METHFRIVKSTKRNITNFLEGLFKVISTLNTINVHGNNLNIS